MWNNFVLYAIVIAFLSISTVTMWVAVLQPEKIGYLLKRIDSARYNEVTCSE